MTGSKKQAYFNRDEITQDEIAWDWGMDDAPDEPGAPYEPGEPIKGDRSGHAYNARAWRGNDGQYRELPGTWERDQLDDMIDAQRELDRVDVLRKNVLLLNSAGHGQKEIGELLGVSQQRVSEILRIKTNSVKL